MDVQRSERGIQHVVDEREQRAENDFSEAETGVFTGTQCRMTFQSGTSQGVEAAHETANTEQACHCQQGVDGFSPLTKRGCGGPGNAVKGGHFKAKLRTGSIHERLQTCQSGTEEEAEQCLPCIHLTARFPLLWALASTSAKPATPTNVLQETRKERPEL